MRIIFFGSSIFAVPSLEALNQKEEVVLIVTQPDRKKGRFSKVAPTAVKKAADRLGIKTFQPRDVNDKGSIEYLKGFSPDIFVVASFGQLLSKDLLNIPKIFAINVHASLLPKYRGAAPINWAIVNGERETGVTVIKMNEKMDEGDIILKDALPIEPDDDAAILSNKLAPMGAKLLLKAIDLIKNERCIFTKQDELKATYAPELKKKDGLIDWKENNSLIYNKIRAFLPWPGCFTFWNKKLLKIWKAKPEVEYCNAQSIPGTILEVDKNGILVCTGKGALRILELQLESKRRMKVEEFIKGHKIVKGEVFSL